MFGDQHRAQALSCAGDPNVRTPNIDRLARQGVRFDAACAGTPWCTPFRAALLTGRYPHQVGAPRTPSALDPSIPTLAAPFRGAGYHTAYIGKWHLDGSNHDHVIAPGRRGGFDYWMGYENYNAPYDVYIHGTGRETPSRLPGYETDGLTDELIQHLESHVAGGGAREGAEGGAGGGHQPFFAVLSVTPPHDPYIAPPQYAGGFNPSGIQLRPSVPDVPRIIDRARENLAGYYPMIENLDWNVGRILAALRRLEIDEHTYIVFFSDHGDMQGSHGQFGKSSPWEEAVRIPFIVSGLTGARLNRVGRCDAVVNHVDIAPTTLGLCGIDAPADMAGHNYANRVFRDPPGKAASADDEPDSAYLQQLVEMNHPHRISRPWRGVVTRDRWKYAVIGGQPWLMFNLNEDLYEQANLVHDRAFDAQRRRLHDRLARWIADTGDHFDLCEP